MKYVIVAVTRVAVMAGEISAAEGPPGMDVEVASAAAVGGFLEEMALEVSGVEGEWTALYRSTDLTFGRPAGAEGR